VKLDGTARNSESNSDSLGLPARLGAKEARPAKKEETVTKEMRIVSPELLRIALIVFGLLDAVLFGRFIDSISIVRLYSSVPQDLWWFQVSVFVRTFFLFSLAVSALGLTMECRWALILSYVQFPLRFAYLYLSFGFLTLFNPLLGGNTYQALIVTAMILEGARLVATILLHVRIAKLPRK